MVDALLADLGVDRVSLVGHDIGGGVASRLAVHQPDRVRRLVLSNAACYDSWPVEFIHGLGLPGTVAELSGDGLEERMAFVFDEGLYGDPDDHAEFCAGMRAPWQSEAGRRSLVRNAISTNTNHTTELDYGRVEADTLLLWGADDVLQSIDYAERLRTDIGGGTELVAFDSAYHWVVEDRTDTYREELRAWFGPELN
jgi:pimeloyl-ACP methyl ester carboxylesterase